MIFDILVWILIIYIGLVLIARVVITITDAAYGFHEHGFFGVLFMFIGNVFSATWHIIKLALIALIIIFILRTCVFPNDEPIPETESIVKEVNTIIPKLRYFF
jgi:uncharacterized membrane protein